MLYCLGIFLLDTDKEDSLLDRNNVVTGLDTVEGQIEDDQTGSYWHH